MSFELSTSREIQHVLTARLRTIRLAQNMTQEELSAMAGISVMTVRNMENRGQCTLDTLIRVVQSLGLASELDVLFLPKGESIRELKALAKASTRQRAHKPRRKVGA